MKDFITAALPFVVCGSAIICLVMNRNKKESYIGEGMCLGMCFGSMIGAMSPSYLGLSLSLGMLIVKLLACFLVKNRGCL